MDLTPAPESSPEGLDNFCLDNSTDRGEITAHPCEAGTGLSPALLIEVVASLLRMPAKSRDVIAWRIAGMTYANIGAALGMSAAGAEKRHRAALLKWPGLAEYFSAKAVRAARRKLALPPAGRASSALRRKLRRKQARKTLKARFYVSAEQAEASFYKNGIPVQESQREPLAASSAE